MKDKVGAVYLVKAYGKWRIAPLVFSVGRSWRWVVSCLCQRQSDILEIRKVSSLPGMKAQFVSPPACGTATLPNDQWWLILKTSFIKEFYMFHVYALRNIYTHTVNQQFGQLLYFTGILVKHLMVVTKAAETCRWILMCDNSILYQCAFVGLLHKCEVTIKSVPVRQTQCLLWKVVKDGTL